MHLVSRGHGVYGFGEERRQVILDFWFDSGRHASVDMVRDFVFNSVFVWVIFLLVGAGANAGLYTPSHVWY